MKKREITAMPASKKPWGGRFEEATDAAVERFSASVHFDRALARYDIRGSIAHARMLADTGIISPADAELLVSGLQEIETEIEAGEFPFDAGLEDIHMNIEARLRERVGEVAGRLHSGRSRNDQVATDLALYLRDANSAAIRGLLELRRVLVERAAEHVQTVLPGYTHLQRAQPVRLAHHRLAYASDSTRRPSAQVRWRVRPCPWTATTPRRPSGSGRPAATAWTRSRHETLDSSSWPPPLSPWFTCLACRKNSSSGRPPNSASSSWPMPIRQARA